ncbi:MAG: YhfC family intramembrane metalloprotease [Candidatus Gastranaerophilales bacterium]|nr:YhfC family intramembrane metalloprotease [Candidatus Gastranaerophilales bacterium]
MLTTKVPGVNIAAMFITLLICLALPIGLCIFWKKKTKAKLSAFFLGCGTFFLFALILEQLLHLAVMAVTGNLLQENLWFYAIYGGLAAGLFEETGRFLAMRFCMSKSLEKPNAIMYGIGHGGVEAILVTGITYLSNLSISFMINASGMEPLLAGMDETTAATAYAQFSQLWTLSPADFLMGGLERISAIMLHIALSWLVYRAVKEHKAGFYVLAVGIHFLVDAATVLLIQILPVAVLEGILLLLTAALLGLAIRNYKSA